MHMNEKQHLLLQALSLLAKVFRSTLVSINPWQISERKLGDAVALHVSMEQSELRPLHIYIFSQ